jgi:hypothetical protein
MSNRASAQRSILARSCSNKGQKTFFEELQRQVIMKWIADHAKTGWTVQEPQAKELNEACLRASWFLEWPPSAGSTRGYETSKWTLCETHLIYKVIDNSFERYGRVRKALNKNEMQVKNSFDPVHYQKLGLLLNKRRGSTATAYHPKLLRVAPRC